MDLIDRTVRYEGKLVDLVPREFKLLEYFMRRPGQTVTRAKLLEGVWNFQPPAYTNVVDVQIGNLRRKLDPTGNRRVIVSVRSVGFKLNADHSEFVGRFYAGLHSFLNMSLMEARRRKASALVLRFCQSLASLRHRPSQAKVRSTIHRLGKTTKRGA